MTTISSPTNDVQQIQDALRGEFPQAQVYRYNSASIRIRIIDERFKGKSRTERARMVDPIIDSLPDVIQNDVTVVLLLAPEETSLSMMNLEFDHPTPSRL